MQTTVSSKKKFILSPCAEAVYPHLAAPDTKFSPDGKYHVSLVLDPEVAEHAQYLNELRELAQKGLGDGVNLPIRDQVDRHGSPTGKLLVKFTSAHKPKIFDASNRPMDEKTVIGGGSIIQVSASPKLYKNIAGKPWLCLYILAIKVRELVEPTGGTAESYGFGTLEVPAGFEPTTDPTPPAKKQQLATETDLPF